MRLLSAEYPEGSLREMVGDGTDGDGAALSLTHLVVDVADVLGLPGGVVAEADDDTSSFDEGSLQALIGGFAHVSETGLPAAGVDGGDEAGVARELVCRAEAIDAADLALDDDGQDVSDTGNALLLAEAPERRPCPRAGRLTRRAAPSGMLESPAGQAQSR